MTTSGLPLIDVPAVEPRRPAVAAKPARPAACASAVTFFRSKTAKTALLALLFLLGAELAVRARAYLRYGVAGAEADIYEVDPVLGRVPKASATMVSAGATTTINRWRMRGADFALEKPAGVTRILCLGESTTFGQPCDDDESIWPARLQTLLDQEAPGRFEVLNGAMPGYTVSSSRVHFQRRFARFNPDIVVINHAATNISAHARREFSPEDASGRLSLAALRDQYSLAYVLLRANTSSWLASQFPAARTDHLDEHGLDVFTSEMKALIADCRATGARVIVCTFPRAFDLDQPLDEQMRLAESALFFNPQVSVKGLVDAYQRYNTAIRALARDTHTQLVDLDRTVPSGDADFIDSVHLSPAGHDLVAETILSAINTMTHAPSPRKEG